MKLVKYAISYGTQEVTDHEYKLVQSLYGCVPPQKGIAIKFIRDQYSLGLKEAKDICDTIGEYVRPGR